MHSWNITEHSESDYAILTREFEDHVDEKVLEAVKSAASADAEGSAGATFTAVATVEKTVVPTRTC